MTACSSDKPTLNHQQAAMTTNELFNAYQEAKAHTDFAAVRTQSVTQLYERLVATSDDQAVTIDGQTFRGIRSSLIAHEAQAAALAKSYPTLGDLWNAAQVDPKAMSLAAVQGQVAPLAVFSRLETMSSLDLVGPFNGFEHPNTPSDFSSTTSEDGSIATSPITMRGPNTGSISSAEQTAAWLRDAGISSGLQAAGHGNPNFEGSLFDKSLYAPLVCHEQLLQQQKAAQQNKLTQGAGLIVPLSGYSPTQVKKFISDVCLDFDSPLTHGFAE